MKWQAVRPSGPRRANQLDAVTLGAEDSGAHPGQACDRCCKTGQDLCIDLSVSFINKETTP